MFENHLPYRSDFQYSHNGALYHHFILGYILHDFLAHIATNWKNAESEKSVSRKKSNSHIGAWLVVDEKNKKVEYQVDPKWWKNASEEEQNTTLAKMTGVAATYRRAGYAIIELVKKLI